MALSLASDVLHYPPAQLESLAQHIQTTGGELTSPIMQVYEEDILLFFLLQGVRNLECS